MRRGTPTKRRTGGKKTRKANKIVVGAEKKTDEKECVGEERRELNEKDRHLDASDYNSKDG